MTKIERILRYLKIPDRKIGNRMSETACTLCGYDGPNPYHGHNGEEISKIFEDKRISERRCLSKLEIQLADALYRTWNMLPMDLRDVRTDNADYFTPVKIAEISDQASDALGEAEKVGWKFPDDPEGDK